jgi:peptidoglycan-associated lipoprotein
VKTNARFYLVVTILFGLFALWGCPKRAEVTTSPESQSEKVTAAATPPAATGSESKSPGSGEEANERATAAAEGLQPIYFEFDKSFIRDDAKSALKANADWLKANPKVKVNIEGNCDERGTKEYNQALGQRRAASAKKYLADMGIASSRISLISYGKEKPVCSENSESCWQKNRRDDFVAESR